jgi:hypothetical protein
VKSVLGLSFLIPFATVFVQVDEIKIERSYGEMDYAPQIAGYFDGEIPIDQFCDTRGVFTGRGLKIVVFDVDYYDGEQDKKVHIVGNQIPDSICLYIRKYRIGSEVYFTNIKAVDLDGSIKNLTPLRLIAVKQEDD